MIERIPFEACPLCDARRFESAAVGDCSSHPLYVRPLSPVMVWKRCCACRHVFTEGHYSEEANRLIFGRANEHQQVGWQIEQQRVTWARAVERVLPHAAVGDWLDVGFGNAALLFTVQEYGFTPVGIDLRADNVQALASLGIEAHRADLAALDFAERFAVISMADVLEHVPFPRPMLRAAHRALAAEGVLFVSMPNMESMVWRALDLQQANPYWGELEHCHNFSRTRLHALLRAEGFEPLRYGISERYRAGMEVVARKR